MAIIVSVMLPETNPDLTEGQTEARLSDTLKGYIKVVRDRLFMSFMIISILSIVVYMQMNSTLPVYLRDFHGVPPQGYGYLVSLNAGMVVLLQFWFTRKTSTKAPMLMMALGTVFYAVGFGLFGFISHYALFMLAMILITIGEMIVSPIGSALVAKFSPEDMRGRYLAVYSIAWGIPIAIGPLAAGIIMDKYDPNWVWYGSGIVSMIAVIGFLSLRTHARRRFSEIR